MNDSMPKHKATALTAATIDAVRAHPAVSGHELTDHLDEHTRHNRHDDPATNPQPTAKNKQQ